MKIPNNEKNVFNCGERDLFTHLATKLTIHHLEKKRRHNQLESYGKLACTNIDQPPPLKVLVFSTSDE
jgi:hypothetical protein